MGWFSEQIRSRKQMDDEALRESFENIAHAVMGERITSALNDDRAVTQSAVDIILKYFRIKSRQIPESIDDMNEQLEYLLRPNGIMRRTVKLEPGWYKDAVGPMLGMLRDGGRVVALIPTGLAGYSYFCSEKGKLVKIGRKNQALFEDEAIAFYKPLPLKRLTVVGLVRYVMKTRTMSDKVLSVMASLGVALVGMLAPKITNTVFSDVVESKSVALLLAITVFSVCVTVSSALFTAVKNLISARSTTRMSLGIQAATMMRVMSLPAGFFKEYSSGDLNQRITDMNSLADMVITTLYVTGLTSLFSIVYIVQIVNYAPGLVLPAVFFTLLTIAFMVLSSLVEMRIARQTVTLVGAENGMTYSLITGVQKIKLAGAEKRAFARWANLWAKLAQLRYNPPIFIKINSVISMAISLVGTVVMYYIAVLTRVSVADYYAFNTAYGMVSGAFMSLSAIVLTASKIKPVLERIKPILETVPEVSEGRQMVTRLSGGLEINNLSFRYSPGMPNVIDDLSLKIRPGQYVAIVGRTGCGKSTLMRLLLGLETPDRGAIYYDGRDLTTLDLKSLRRRVGSVMQEGRLFQGDIYSNIVISAPWLSVDAAWEAAELAGIAEDIRHMPMGMHTVISEGSGGVSGGQRQRLMIARAIAPKPKILMFDEATSALDNITQKRVSQSLDGLRCTRIVIAHRLSTIRHCDRIIVLDKGRIVEDGRYEELIEKKGYFAELVERQRLDA